MENPLSKLLELVKPKHVIGLSVYFQELTGLFHATITINEKPTGINMPTIGHAVSGENPNDAVRDAAIDALEKFTKHGAKAA